MHSINLKTAILFGLLLCGSYLSATAQITYDLPRLLRENRLVSRPANELQLLNDNAHPGVSTKGIVWLKGVNFRQGTIDIDLRGKDVFLKSFLGIAFHGVDTLTYDVVYFRPFNFRHSDTLRRKWSVQYMSMPGHEWPQLRKDSPLKYENAVNPVPMPDEWFHCTIQLTDSTLSVFVNQATTPSLTVQLLNHRPDGLIGLWADSLSGDFSRLTLKPTP